MATLPRGIRNHNPGNLRRTGDRWRGLASTQGDAEFFQFIAPEWGIRAMALVLKTYQVRHGRNTVADLINRWAPPVGDRNGSAPGGKYTQNTSSYVNAVAKALAVKPNDRIDVRDPCLMYGLVCAIIEHENGQQPYGRDTINQGLHLAGLK